MFTVSDVVSVVELDLMSGALSCPACAGRLRPWGWLGYGRATLPIPTPIYRCRCECANTTVCDPLELSYFSHPARRVKNPAQNPCRFQGHFVELCDAKPHEPFDRVRTYILHDARSPTTTRRTHRCGVRADLYRIRFGHENQPA